MAPSTIVIFLLLTAITNSLLVQYTKYQITSLQLPITNSCISNKFNIKSVSFVNLNIFHMATTHQPSTDPLKPANNKYIQYTLHKSVPVSPSQLNNIIININTNQQNICSPSYLILPIINTAINIKCIYNQYNSITNTMSYNCNPLTLISNTPNTTIFYPMDDEYKRALQKYNEQYPVSRRRLNDNNYNTTTVEIADINPKNNNNPITQFANNYHPVGPILIWLFIGTGIVCISSICCCLGIYCTKIKRDKKKMNAKDIGANKSESEALYNKNGINHMSIINILSPSAITLKSASITSDIDGNIGTKSISKSISLLSTNNNNNNNNNNNKILNEYVVVPIDEDQDTKPAKSRSSINIIEMADIVHGTQRNHINNNNNNDDITSSDLSQENSEEKQVSIDNTEVCITNKFEIDDNDIDDNDIEEIKPHKTGHHRNRYRIYTDSFTTTDIISNGAESVYSAHSLPTTEDDDGRSYRSGYDNDDEDEDDDDDDDDDDNNDDNDNDINHIPIISPQLSPNWMVKSKSLHSKYMMGLLDEDEEEEEFDSDDAAEIAKKVRSVHRRSSSLGDLIDKRRDSGDIDHDKLYKNWWGTSIPLHEGSKLIEGNEELKKHKFFYHAPKIKIKRKKKTKKQSFKIRIKNDTNAVKELEDDVINQMITDSEMSGADSLF